MNYNNGNIDFYPGSLGGGERYWRVVSPNKQPVVAGLLVIKSPKCIWQSLVRKGINCQVGSTAFITTLKKDNNIFIPASKLDELLW